MLLVIKPNFKPKHRQLQDVKEHASLCYHTKQNLPHGLSVIDEGDFLHYVNNVEKAKSFTYVQLTSETEYETRFQFHMKNNFQIENLARKYSFNPPALFSKYLQDLSMIKGNTYIDDTVQSCWSTWINDQFKYYGFID